MSTLLVLNGKEGYGVRRVWDGLILRLPQEFRPATLALLSDARLEDWQSQMPDDVEVVAPAISREFQPVGSGLRKFTRLVQRMRVQRWLGKWLQSVIRNRSAERILTNSPLEIGMVALAARRQKARVYWLMPNSVSQSYPLDLNRRIYRFLFRHLKVVPVANSDYTDTTLGAGDFERHVVHLGIDPDHFRPMGSPLSREALGIPHDVPIFGLFARMVEEKGHLVLAEALTTVPEDIHVLICGGPTEGAYYQRLRDRVDELGLSGRFTFVGPQSDVLPYYALCDVVLNTRLDPEPFGMSVIEAMSMGKPVLAHRAGGPGETILDDRTSWLIEAPTPEAFAIGLRRALDSRSRWPEMSGAARAHVLENYTLDAFVDRLAAIIR